MYSLVFMFMSGIMGFILNRKHLLLMLVSLEFTIISLYLNMFLYLSVMHYEFFFSMIFLSISVCEGVLGLSILIMMVRVHGNDFILTFSSLW
uniref:NADH-ubiquinone oxidoreductase chain 4L n=1 Tax=Psylliodes gougeleti TaxID=467380 RepID=A0A3G1GNE5_9CUCU|nr:NADH dehydrogenase subunit 4L [Psylliodes gougeleti]